MRQRWQRVWSCAEIVRDRIRETPSRPALAACGVMAAAAVVVASLCLVDAAFKSFSEGVIRLGSDIAFVRATPSAALEGIRGLTPPEVRLISNLDSVETAVPLTAIGGSVRGCGKRLFVTIQGAIPEHLALENLRLRRGRFITDVDNDTSGSVVVLGDRVAADVPCLFLGDALDVSGFRMTIVGVLKQSSDASDNGADFRVFMPLSRAVRRYGWPRAGVDLLLRLKPDWPASAVKSQVANVLRRTAGRVRSRDRDFEVHTRDELLRSVDAARSSVAMLVFGFLGIGIVIAGLGVAGTVSSSVLERQAEIGVARCVGASGARIKAEFLVEGIAIGFGGALTGAFLGAALARIVGWMAELPQGEWFGYVVAATAIGTFFSAASAAIPAARAAGHSPMEALRLER